RQLEGALVYLTAQAKLTGATLTPQIINKLLTCTTPKQDIKLLLQTVADYFNLTVEALISPKKDRKTALARGVAIYLMREGYNCSLTEIGKELGGRNHATILHSYEKLASELSINPNLANQVTEIKRKAGPHKG
ncbi:MAG: chromosomal replication initiator protein DnaA, partial [Dehalococcoidia bacterium]|nr:chromosomal replication initiator protein DnaA [Dehalococcoidia bacterium]